VTERSRAKTGARKAPKKKGATEAAEASGAFADLSFEQALEQLEGIVDRLEEGDLDLADALAGFEEGVQLTRHCHEKLEAAERRIEVLTGEGSSRPFATDASVSEDDD